MYRLLLALIALLAAAGCRTAVRPGAAPAADRPTLTSQHAGTDVLFIGVSPVDARVAWLSGTGGTYARTTDGGATWRSGVVPGADSLQFRDVHAVDAQTAYLLSAGPGAASRIYKTVDGGATWTLQFTNPEPEGFFDCFDFWDADHGLAFSDAVRGAFVVVTTSDGGATWARVPAEALPPAQPGGEGGFAASGTCVRTAGEASAWIGTGAAPEARVLYTADGGRTWTAFGTPLTGGPAAGIASLSFRDARHGAALGGDIASPDTVLDNVAVTADGGRTWRLAGRPTFAGPVYGSAYVPGARRPTLVAVGPGGASYSADDGATWARLDTVTYWGVAFAGPSAGWAVGPGGRITRIAFE